MQDGNFEINKDGWYTVQNVEPNDFINDNLATDEYGIYYSVKFVGDAETFLWQTKTPPLEGEKYWGHIEKAKSGKSLKFKWDKKNTPSTTPDGKPTLQARQQATTSNSITLGMVWKIVAQIRGLPENDEDFAKFFEIVDSHWNELLLMSEKRKDEV